MPPKLQLVHAWLVRANNDLVTAERALAGEPPVRDTPCFHAQQAVEKALKALLILREIDPPKTHLIGMLLDKCGIIDERLTNMSDQLEWLTAFAVEARYPDVEDEPTVDQARNALSIAQRAVEIIVENVPEESRP